MSKLLNYSFSWPLVALLDLYQKTFSPDHGWLKVFYPHGFCKFYPTCSEYALQGLRQRGTLALPKIFTRLLRCNPFNPGGVDLPRF